MFRRLRHNAILSVLRKLDGDLLAACACHFGGGTAIVLALDEYRESIDIDFLCASTAGYRDVRTRLRERGMPGIARDGAEITAIRDVRTDQYGLRTVIEEAGVRIKFEIVREARLDTLAGTVDPRYGVPVLDRDFLFIEKLLANDDRGNDRATMSRDIIDLSMMVSRWGQVPDAAWTAVEAVYGDRARRSYDQAVDRIRDRGWLERCAASLNIDPPALEEILAVHGGEIRRTSPFG